MVSRMIRFVAPAAGLLAAACVEIPDPPIVSRAVDPTSPAAQRVLRAAEEAKTAPYPRWTDVPTYPQDVRPLTAWNAAAEDVMGARDELGRWRQANPPELTDTEAFARSQREQVDVGDLPPAPTPEESAAYAREQRARAAGD